MKKLTTNLLLTMMFMLLIAACSNGTDKPSNTSKPQATPNNSSTTESSSSGDKYDPPIKMTFAVGRVDADVVFPDGQSTKDNQWTRLVEEKLGIKLDVTLAMPKGQEFTQKVNALIVTNDLPDLFTVSEEEMIQVDQLIQAGIAEDLTDLFEEYASPLVKQLMPDEALEPLKRNGRLYFLPNLQRPAEEGFMTWIRTDWLKKLNIPEPKTFQDVIAIAEAFKAMNPTKNYGFQAGTESWDMYSLSGLFAAYHAYPNAWLKDANGNLVNGNIQPEVKAALQSLQNLKKEGLISNEWTLGDDGEKARQDLINGRVGIHFGQWWAPEWPLQLVKDNDPEAEWKAFKFMSVDGQPALHLQNTVSLTGLYVLKKGHSNPEALIKMLNLVADFYWGENPQADPDNSNLWKLAPGDAQPWGKNIVFMQSIEKALKSGDASKLHPGEQVLYNMIEDYNNGNDEFWGVSLEYGIDGSLGLYDSFQWINNEFFGTPTVTMNTKQANLNKLFEDAFISIVNGADINKFDTFVEQWKKQGGDDITKEVNDWYKSRK
ncbi:putative aldouronate transport system substrate-binding protein [Paenibacillus castaneae]|uniref:extracellular solute-binding protein n=1 Tax=Paenibacillus castaneae TaxID=474957 RepID=UPI00141ACDF9|nr:extracellular solute-binding protein [Paenibacillus castaneae]NIK78694.1 putative aldouronate transport system substrate-binding protein [Paenibacillus castaneae]